MFLEFITSYFAPITFFQSILMAVFLFGLKKGERIQNRLLALFLLAFGLMIGARLAWAKIGFEQDSVILGIGTNMRFFIAPLLYLYLRAIFKPTKKLKPIDLLHTLLFVFVTINQLTFQYKGIYNWETYVLFDIIQIFAYLLWSFIEFQLIYLFRKRAVFNFTKRNIYWLQFFIVANIINWLYLVYSLIFVNKIFSDPGLCIWFTRIIGFSNFIFATSILYIALKAPDLFQIKRKNGSEIPEDVLHSYIVEIEDYMGKNKPFLNPELSLQSLANELNMSAKQLSFIINKNYGQNFYHFINSYRIETCKKMLADPELKKESVLRIAFKAGFNSKNTFNMAFKKNTGMTPSEFRKRQLEKSS